MNPDCQRFEPDWELAVLGALEDGLVDDMERHALGCVVCRARLLEAQAGVAGLSAVAPAGAPSPSVEGKLRARILASGKRPAPWRGAPWLLAAASLAAAAWLGWDRVQLQRQLQTVAIAPVVQAPPLQAVVPAPPTAPPPAVVVKNVVREEVPPAMLAQLADLRRQNEQLTASANTAEQQREQAVAALRAMQVRVATLEREIADAAIRLAAIQRPAAPAPNPELATMRQAVAAKQAETDQALRQLGELKQVVKLLRSPTLRQIDLRAADPAARQASGRALLAADGSLVLFLQGMPTLPAGKCYQLWLIGKSNPAIVSGGLLQTDGQGNGVLVTSASAAQRLTGLAITDEPAGGSVSAQGHKLLFGMI